MIEPAGQPPVPASPCPLASPTPASPVAAVPLLQWPTSVVPAYWGGSHIWQVAPLLQSLFVMQYLLHSPPTVQ